MRGAVTLFGQRPEQDTHHSKADSHTEDSADSREKTELGIEHIAREDIEHRVIELPPGIMGTVAGIWSTTVGTLMRRARTAAIRLQNMADAMLPAKSPASAFTAR